MDKTQVLSEIEKTGIVAVLRMQDTTHFDAVVQALIDGGVNAIEITLTTPGALDLIKSFAAQKIEDVYLGAGTVLTRSDAENVYNAGAQFIVSPVLDLEIVKFANDKNVVVCPGAYSPTEIFRAWENGADVVKVFPAASLGPKFFKDIRGPMPFLKLKSGKNKIRVMPPWTEEGTNAYQWWREVWTHWGVGPDEENKKTIYPIKLWQTFSRNTSMRPMSGSKIKQTYIPCTSATMGLWMILRLAPRRLRSFWG